MTGNYRILLSIPLLVIAITLTSCKDKKEHPMVDMESIDYDGSRDDKYIFREELKKEQEKKMKLEKLRKEEME